MKGASADQTAVVTQNHGGFIPGATVRHRETGELATVKYSSFGVKVGGITEDGMHWKTNGAPETEMAKYWEVVDDE